MLSQRESTDLINAFQEICRHIADLREKLVVARHIHYPKIPSELTESIIRQGILPRITGPFTSVTGGGRAADILATRENEEALKIEVKASGNKAFATFGKKTIRRTFLVWVHFGNSLQNDANPTAEIFIFQNPCVNLEWWQEHLEGKKLRDRVNLAELIKAWRGQIERVKLDLNSLRVSEVTTSPTKQCHGHATFPSVHDHGV